LWKHISELNWVRNGVKANLYDIKSLMPEDKEYYKFKGSLTTPPCSENVKWFVYKTPLSVSKEQVNSFLIHLVFQTQTYSAN